MMILALFAMITAELFFKGFSHFNVIDDQGYIMMTLKQYREGHPLYDAVFTQYGPGYYVLRTWLYCGARITHDWTEWVALSHAVLCSLGLGFITYRLTKSVAMALLTLAFASGRVGIFLLEAGHPQETLCLLAVLAVGLAGLSGRDALRSVAIGSLVGFMLLIKVNVGVFLLLPVALYYLGELPLPALRKVLSGLFAAGAAALPFVLMHKHLHMAWALSLAVLLSASLLSLVLLPRASAPSQTWRNSLFFLGSLAVTVLAVLVQQLVRGTSAGGLWFGIIAQHGRLVAEFVNPFPIHPLDAGLALGAFLLFLVWCSARVSTRWTLLACGLFGLGLCGAMLQPGAYFMVRHFAPFFWLVPLAWLKTRPAPIEAGPEPARRGGPAALPDQQPSGHNRPDASFRYFSFLVLTAVFLLLQAYPIAGGQVWCGTIFFPVIGVVAFHLSVRFLASQTRWFTVGRQAGLGALLVCAVLGWKTVAVCQAARAYGRSEPMGLPGAALFRLPPDQTGTWRWLAGNLQRFDTFVTLPGFDSLYFLTEKEPPSTFNLGAWMTIIDDARQRQIVTNLAAYDRVGGVRNRQRARALIGDTDISARPLADYMEHRMKVIGERNGFELLEASPP